MLTKRYMSSTKNLHAILAKIVSGTAPSKFTTAHLKSIGFSTTNDRAVIPILKDLGFLSADGSPTPRYHDYRNPSKSKTVMGEALREAYEDLFHVNALPTKADRDAIIQAVEKTDVRRPGGASWSQACNEYSMAVSSPPVIVTSMLHSSFPCAPPGGSAIPP